MDFKNQNFKYLSLEDISTRWNFFAQMIKFV